MTIRSLTAIALLAGLFARSLTAQESDGAVQSQDQPELVGESADLDSFVASGTVNIKDREIRQVLPGETIVFNEDGAEGGGRNCRIGFGDGGDLQCLLPRFSGTNYFPESNQVLANKNDQQVGLLPNYAAAWVYNDFSVPGPENYLVDGQISVTFDATTSLFGAGAYTTHSFLTLIVSDITNGAPGVTIATHTVLEVERTGDQGLTDIAGTEVNEVFKGENSSFVMKLRCGRTYRLQFQLEVMGQSVLVGRVFSLADANWTDLRVSLDKCLAASQERMGHGCDGVDDNCNGTIDECGEDTFGPLVFIDQSVTKCCYDDVGKAAEAVALGVKAWDDCGNIKISPPIVNGTQCDVSVDVTATDDCGNSTTASTIIRIDDHGPSIIINPAVADVCYASIDDAEQAVRAATTITDNCDSVDDLTITLHSSVEECALRVRIKAVDTCGNESTAAVTVRVDTHLPSVDIEELLLGFRGEVLAFQTPVCYETAAQAEAAVLEVTQFADNCTANETLSTSVSSAGNTCSLTVTSQAVDECLNENTDSVTVRVDAEDPVVTCKVTVDTLSPPNHKMINVGFTFTATDNCTGEPQIEIFITSDETTASADGAGQTSPAPDAFILHDLDDIFQGILLRKERSSAGNGRVYEITVRATDECGNVGSCAANVSVPPNGNQTAVDDGQFFDATEVN